MSRRKTTAVTKDVADVLDAREIETGEAAGEQYSNSGCFPLGFIFGTGNKIRYYRSLLETDIQFRVQIIFFVFFILLSLLIVVATIIAAVLQETSVFVWGIGISVLVAGGITTFIATRRIWPVDVQPNEVWIVSKHSVFDRPQAVRFIDKSSKLRLDETIPDNPYLITSVMSINDIFLEDIPTRDHSKIDAKVDAVVVFDPLMNYYAKTPSADTSDDSSVETPPQFSLGEIKIIAEMSETKLLDIVRSELINVVWSVIQSSDEGKALGIPRDVNHTFDLFAAGEEIRVIFNLRSGSLPLAPLRATKLVNILYQPKRAADVEKALRPYLTYEKGMEYSLLEASKSGNSILETLVARKGLMETLKGLPQRTRFPASAYELDLEMLEAAKNRDNKPLEPPTTPSSATPSLEAAAATTSVALPPAAPPPVVPPEILEPARRVPIEAVTWQPGHMPAYILYIEDDPLQVEEMQWILQREKGVVFDTAGTESDALSKLEQNFYTVLLCDINLDLRDPDNVGGINVLEKLKEWGHLGAIENSVIILSSLMKDHLDRIIRDLKIPYESDYQKLQKQESPPTKRRDAVRTAIKESGINFALQIGEQKERGHESEYLDWLVKAIGAPIYPLKMKAPSRERLSKEVEVVIRKLYNTRQGTLCEQVFIETLKRGQYGSTAHIRASWSDGQETSEVILVGYHDDIGDDGKGFLQRFKKFVADGQIVQITGIDREARTPYLKGFAYSLAGFPVDSFLTLGELYKNQPSFSLICDQINMIFSSLSRWYDAERPRQRFEFADIGEYYQNILGVDDNHSLPYITDIDTAALIAEYQSFTLKGARANEALGDNWRIKQPRPRLLPTHGNFRAQNVLLSDVNRENGRALMALLDFSRTGWGHPLFDFVTLEADIRLNVIPQGLDLENYHLLDRTLIRGEKAPTKQTPEFEKAFKVLGYVQEQAYLSLDHLYTFESHEYHMALLFHLLRWSANEKMPEIARKRAIVTASHIIKRYELL